LPTLPNASGSSLTGVVGDKNLDASDSSKIPKFKLNGI
jgi:hypothetical protein